jgi:hypothetical protein
MTQLCARDAPVIQYFSRCEASTDSQLPVKIRIVTPHNVTASHIHEEKSMRQSSAQQL